MQSEKENGEHPEHPAPDANESSSKTKGKARKNSGREEVSSETLEDRGTELNNRKEGVPVSEAQVNALKIALQFQPSMCKQVSKHSLTFNEINHS